VLFQWKATGFLSAIKIKIMSTEFIALLANLALTLSFIVAVIFGIAQVKTANRDRRERLTLDTLRTFQTKEFAELINFITIARIPASFKEWQNWPEEGRIRFIQFGQEMESLGMLLAERLINVDLVDKTLGSFVISSWEKYKPLVLDMREKMPDPFLDEYFQWMAAQMDQRMKDNPRKPFFEMNKTAV
jgi:hypothetical protein